MTSAVVLPPSPAADKAPRMQLLSNFDRASETISVTDPRVDPSAAKDLQFIHDIQNADYGCNFRDNAPMMAEVFFRAVQTASEWQAITPDSPLHYAITKICQELRHDNNYGRQIVSTLLEHANRDIVLAAVQELCSTRSNNAFEQAPVYHPMSAAVEVKVREIGAEARMLAAAIGERFPEKPLPKHRAA